MSLLEVVDLSVFYGPVRGVGNVSLTVDRGQLVALLGANGAGKSTVLKAISGLVSIRSGEVSFRDQNLAGVSAPQRVLRGLVQVPEGRRIFPALSVLENLALGGYGFGRRGTERRARIQEVLGLFPILQIDLRKLAGMLSGGEQQILAIARGLMAQPQLLMVDEPSLGLAPQMVESVYEMLEAIAAQGTAVLLVEQNVTLALEITQRAYVLQQGRLVLSGESAGLVADSRVVDAYLGTAPVREQTLA
jgi:branched-chain amino acid transport system ATP-binding protein